MKHDHRPEQWLHPLDCDCDTCRPYHPSAAERLSLGDLTRLAAAGLVTGLMAGFALALM